MPGRQYPRSNLDIEFAAAPRNNSFIFKPQLQTTECDFESSRAFIVCNEEVRYPQCKRIECAAG